VTDVIGSGLVKVEVDGKGVVLNFAGDKWT
jgi:hypothetical protein